MCQGLIVLAAQLYDVWQPFLNGGLLRRIPENLSGRLARRIVDGNLTPVLVRQALDPALRLRRRYRVLSQSEDTLEALFEQHLRLRRGDPASLAHLGATAELDTVQRFAANRELRPQNMHLIPDGRSGTVNGRRTPDAVLVHAEIPAHLQGMGRTERLEITMVTGPVAEGRLAQRVSTAIERKIRDTNGPSQLTSPLIVQGERIPPWGTVAVRLPSSPPLTRAIVDQVHNLLSSGDSANLYEQFTSLQRYVIHQGDTMFSVVRTSPTDFTIRAL